MGKFWYKIRINANLDYYVFCTPDEMVTLLALINGDLKPPHVRGARKIHWKNAERPDAMLHKSGARTLDWLIDHYK